MKPTRKRYEKLINDLGQELPKEAFYINGVFMKRYYPNKRGKMLRKHDPIQFDIDYNQFCRDNTKQY